MPSLVWKLSNWKRDLGLDEINFTMKIRELLIGVVVGFILGVLCQPYTVHNNNGLMFRVNRFTGSTSVLNLTDGAWVPLKN
jgi:hypothetical protein